MYHLLKNTRINFVIIVSPNDEYYPTYIKYGYEKINEGTYKEMQEIQKQVVEEYLKTLPNETN
jgi:hypothetical protein